MNAYFVIGILTALWAVGLAAVGLTREDFPPSDRVLHAIIGVTTVLVIGTLATLFATTTKEHPRQEAEAKAAEAQSAGGAGGAGGQISADENEFNIDLSTGDTLNAGKYTFKADNSGRVEHDLAIQGNGTDKQTPLIKPGGSASLTVDLAPGSYKVYCTVPGHEQAGMKVDLTVQ
jgi:plastocyanin